jgi:hypothetical protein
MNTGWGIRRQKFVLNRSSFKENDSLKVVKVQPHSAWDVVTSLFQEKSEIFYNTLNETPNGLS